MDWLLQDLRYTFRSLARTPAFVAVVIVTLGLGIGANAAIFSLLDQILLRTLPVRAPHELVQLDGPGPFMGRTFNDQTFSYPMYEAFRDWNTVFDGVIARYPTNATAVWQGQAERVDAELVTGNYFEVLGIQPFVGRLLGPEDDVAAGAHAEVVLGHGYWTRRLGGDPNVVGRALTLNGHPYTIVGVTPPAFYGLAGGTSPDVMVPVHMKAAMTPLWDDLDEPRSRWLNVVARLRPGVSIAQATAAMNVIYRQVNAGELENLPVQSETFRTNFLNKTLVITSAATGIGGELRDLGTPMIVLMAMVGMVLLIACANVANLLVARGVDRRKDVAIRQALGAARGRIVRQRLVESLALAGGGAAVGLLLSLWLGRLLVAGLPDDGAVRALSATPDARVVWFTIALSVVTAIVFGLGPALQSTRRDAVDAIKDDARGASSSAARSRVRKSLVVAQVALSTILLAGAGLFARSLFNLHALDPGFAIDDVLTFSVDPSLSSYTPERTRQLYARLQEDIAALPGVHDVSMTQLPILTNSSWRSTTRIEGYVPKDGEDMNAVISGVGPRFFRTLQLPLIQGRDFTEQDVRDAPAVAVVSESYARRFFGTESPLGHRLGFGGSPATAVEIVGVAKDARIVNLRSENARVVYFPAAQDGELGAATFYLRTDTHRTDVAAVVRDLVRRTDPGVPIYDVRTLPATIGTLLFVERAVAALSLAFGTLATLLAAIGLYGVMSFAVQARTREIGIRLALGAERRTVLGMIFREIAWLAGTGLVVGVPLALALGGLVKTQLFGVSSLDPVTLLTVAVVLAGTAATAGYLPARRATRVDPVYTLRHE